MSKKFTHIDLFSGIGGFALAAKQIWGEAYQNLFFCDIDKFCQAVLRKNFGKDIIIYDDIKEISKEQFIADSCSNGQFRSKEQNSEKIQPQNETSRWNNIDGYDVDDKRWHVDLLTAGPPCQPASQAGKRKGTKDNRWLWNEMFKVIQDFKPTWCIIENVYGLVSLEQGLVFESVFADMEGLGYEVQPFIVGAVGKNAPHKRYRVWFILHAKQKDVADSDRDSCHAGQSRRIGGKLSEAGEGLRRGQSEGEAREEFGNGIANAPDSEHEGYIRGSSSSGSNRNEFCENEQTGQEPRGATSRCGEEHPDVGNAEGTGLQSAHDRQGQIQHGRTSPTGFAGWNRNWFEVATEFCGVDDGLPVELDELELTKSKHREQRLKSLGNAVVVPLVATFLQFMKEIEETPDADKFDFKSEQIKYVNIDEKSDRYIVMKDLRNY